MAIGKTIAAIAGGIDVAYPPENEKITEGYCQKMPHAGRGADRHSPHGEALFQLQPGCCAAFARAGGDRGSVTLGLANHGAHGQ